ncbi:D-alanyl-D-alanine carboxypeptidase family protein [Phenylobacterium sp.]|uniref:D-alanyl-D-alanine carboxypeptidase family protein n=1 Tax=Phenylobacterium sp. TaxID=1871053 RepID=UPI0030F43EF6
MTRKPSRWRRFRQAAGGLLAATVALTAMAASAQTPRSVCTVAAFEPPARINASSLRSLVWAPFRRDEIGWEIYARQIQRELRTTCAPDTSRFAQLLAGFQKRFRMKATGQMDADTFLRFKGVWQERRPFVMVNLNGYCPPAPDPATLAIAAPTESYGGKTIPLRPGTLNAYRAMVAAAKREVPAIAKDTRSLTIFSGFRDPDADAARCLADANCDGVVRATCSPHRTGLALDLYVGQAPGYGPDSSADPNRLYMTRTPTYGWLAANAHRFGFVNYPFEPWHWEWIGQAP